MDNQLLIQSLIGMGGVPFIMALVQAIKPFITDTRFYTLAAIGLGLLINFGATWALGASDRVAWVAAGFLGIMAGLAGSGLYSNVSSAIKGATNQTPTPTPPVTPIIPTATGTK